MSIAIGFSSSYKPNVGEVLKKDSTSKLKDLIDYLMIYGSGAFYVANRRRTVQNEKLL